MQRIIINTNVSTQENYNQNGFSYRGGNPRIVANSEFIFEWNLFSATPGADEDGVDVTTWTKHTGYAGCSARLGCDNDWVHRVAGKYAGEAISSGGSIPSSFPVTIAGATDKNIAFSGLVGLYNTSGQFETILYTSRTISGDTVTFDVGSGLTAEYDHANGENVTCSQELLFQAVIDANESDPSNGKFVFHVYAASTKLQKIIDTSNAEVIRIQGIEMIPFSVSGDTLTQYPSLFVDTAVLVTTMQEIGGPDQVSDPVSDQIAGEVTAFIQSGLSQEIWNPTSSAWEVYSGGSGEWKGRYWPAGGGSGATKTEFPLIQGPTGPMPTISAGSATALPAGSNPSVNVVSSGGSTYFLNLGIPAGEKGEPGQNGSLTVPIQPYSSDSAYSALTCIAYNGGGYQVVSATNAGETPDSDPSKFVCFASRGVDGVLSSASLVVSSLVSGAIVIPDTMPPPFCIKTDSGSIYPVEAGTVISSGGYWTIDPTPYYAYDGASAFSGPWTVYFAGGDKGDKGDTGDTPVISGGSVTTLPAGSSATVSVTSSGTTYTFNFAIPGGRDAQFIGESQLVSSLVSGAIVVSNGTIPIALQTGSGSSGTIYPIEKGTISISSGAWVIDPAAYLAYDNSSAFSGPWTVFFAGGVSIENTSSLTSANLVSSAGSVTSANSVTSAGTVNLSSGVISQTYSGGESRVILTQSAYDALETKDPAVWYYIRED